METPQALLKFTYIDKVTLNLIIAKQGLINRVFYEIGHARAGKFEILILITWVLRVLQLSQSLFFGQY